MAGSASSNSSSIRAGILQALLPLVVPIALLLSQPASACTAPRAFFDAGSADGIKNPIVDLLLKSGLQSNSPKCRYRIIGRIDAEEAAQGRDDLALQRARAVVSIFVARGFSEDQFIVEADRRHVYPPGPQHANYRMLDRIASIHSVTQPGKGSCLEPMTTCPICILTLSDGGECRIIPGSGAID